MRIGPGVHGERILLHELVAVGAIHTLFDQTEDAGGDQGHEEVAGHLDDGGREILVVDADDIAVRGKELREADDEHDGGILDVDDVVVADLGEDIADGLGQDDAGHGLEVRHADGLRALGLAGVDGDDAAADGLGHIRARIDGDDQDGRGPDVIKAQGVVGKVRQGVEDEDGLQHHGRAAEDLDVDADDDAEDLQEDALGPGVVFGAGDGIEDAAGKADDAADGSRSQGKAERAEHASQVHRVVFVPQDGDILHELGKLIHGRELLSRIQDGNTRSQCLPFQGRWLGGAETERSLQICDNLSVSLRLTAPLEGEPFPLRRG